jgi:sugar diacid utilization regulator/putative methionine-R-sulfoxide reductase with GAF domain
MSESVENETFARRRSLSATLEPIVAAAMRGQYELLIAEAERAVTRLFPGARARVLMRVGGNWREWSALDGGAEPPGKAMPPDMHQWDQPRRYEGRAFVPIAVGAVGVWVDDLSAGSESSDELGVLRRCLALALQTCERQRIAAQNLDEVQALQRVATRILKIHDLGEILLHITQEAKRLLSADICGVLLRDGDQIAMRRCVGNHCPETAALRMGPGQGLAGRVLARREPSAVEDYLTSGVLSRDFFHLAEAEMIRSALAAPLLGRDTVIGVLEVWRRRPSTFTPLDTMRLVALANLTSIAIENAELYAGQQRIVEELGRANDALNQRYETVNSLSNLTQELMQVLLQGGGLSVIVNKASNFLEAGVAVVDNEGTPLAWSRIDCQDATIPAVFSELLALRIRASRASSGGVDTDGSLGHWRAQPLVVESETVGWVLGYVGPKEAGITEFTLAQVAMVAAVLRLEERAASRARSETIEAVIWDLLQSSEAACAAAVDRAADIKLDLEGPLRLFLCALGTTTTAGGLDQTPSSVRRAVGQVIEASKPTGLRAVAMHGQSVAVVGGDESVDDVERAAQRMARKLEDELAGRVVTVGVSGPCKHARSLSVAYREAQIALDVAKQLGRTGAMVYDRAGVVGMLLSLRHEAGMRRFLELNFRQLLNEEEKHRDQLLQTLRVFFDVNCSQEAAATRLGVHRKTVAYRLAKICELTGLDLSTHDDRLVADLSLYVHRLIAGGFDR